MKLNHILILYFFATKFVTSYYSATTTFPLATLMFTVLLSEAIGIQFRLKQLFLFNYF